MTERVTPEAGEGLVLDPNMPEDEYFDEDADLVPEAEDETDDD